jgi:hypothetical protein
MGLTDGSGHMEMRAVSGYGENLDFSGGMGGKVRTGSMVIGLEKKLCRERSISQVAGIAVADSVTVTPCMGQGLRWPLASNHLNMLEYFTFDCDRRNMIALRKRSHKSPNNEKRATHSA